MSKESDERPAFSDESSQSYHVFFLNFPFELNTKNMNTLEDFQARGLYSPEYEHDACGIQKDYVSKNIL